MQMTRKMLYDTLCHEQGQFVTILDGLIALHVYPFEIIEKKTWRDP
jgi:hypothetical protein